MTSSSTEIRNNFETNSKEKPDGKIILASHPMRISLNLTGKCNIRCNYCHLKYARYYTKQEMTLSRFQKLDPFLKKARYLVFFSSTEPLAADNFTDIFQYSSRYDSEKYLSTNAILMKPDIAEMFVRQRLYFLTVSVAGTTPESFKYYHGIDALEKVKDNIRTLNAFKRKYNIDYPRIRLVFVTMSSNIHMLPDSIQMARELECSEGVKITYLKAYTRELVKELPFHDLERVKKYTEKAKSLALKLGVPITFDGGDFTSMDFDDDLVTHRLCHEPYERFHVEADGKVRVCACPSCDQFAGDINTQDLHDIWNGPVYQEYRRSINTNDMPSGCLRCTHNVHKDFKRTDIWDLSDFEFGVIYERK